MWRQFFASSINKPQVWRTRDNVSIRTLVQWNPSYYRSSTIYHPRGRWLSTVPSKYGDTNLHSGSNHNNVMSFSLGSNRQHKHAEEMLYSCAGRGVSKWHLYVKSYALFAPQGNTLAMSRLDYDKSVFKMDCYGIAVIVHMSARKADLGWVSRWQIDFWA